MNAHRPGARNAREITTARSRRMRERGRVRSLSDNILEKDPRSHRRIRASIRRLDDDKTSTSTILFCQVSKADTQARSRRGPEDRWPCFVCTLVPFGMSSIGGNISYSFRFPLLARSPASQNTLNAGSLYFRNRSIRLINDRTLNVFLRL